MNALDTLRNLDLPQSVRIVDEHQNVYTGKLSWNSTNKEYRINDLKIIPQYDEATVYIVKPLPENDALTGFLAKINSIETVS